jgi:hypothetical protein
LSDDSKLFRFLAVAGRLAALNDERATKFSKVPQRDRELVSASKTIDQLRTKTTYNSEMNLLILTQVVKQILNKPIFYIS